MRRFAWVVGALAALLVAAAVQQSVLMRWGLLGQVPGPVLLVVVIAALGLRPGGAALFGALAGVVEGASAGADLTALALTRAGVAFLVAWAPLLGFAVTPGSAGLLALVGTLLAQGGMLLLAPPTDLGRALGATIGTAIYNGVLAVVLGFLLRRALEADAG